MKLKGIWPDAIEERATGGSLHHGWLRGAHRLLFPAGIPGGNGPSDRYALYNRSMTVPTGTRLERVLEQLRLYEHPLLEFSARAKGEAVEVIIEFKNAPVPVHTYYFDFHPRDLDHPQFEWTFQRQLFDCLHDYIIEMFTRTPQNRVERQREGL